MHLAPAGDRATLIDLGDPISAEALHAAAAYARSIAGVTKVVPGHSSLLVHWNDAPPRALFEAWPELDVAAAASAREVREIGVTFDGEDLDAFLDLHALTREAFIARVQTLTLTARYLGFRAGFAYLDGWPEEWAMPRRATSRNVKRGAFAIAGNVAGFYPLDSPGGWNVLGHTNDDLRIEAGERLRIVHASVSRQQSRAASQDREHASRPFTLINAPLVVETTHPFDDVLGRIARNAVAGDVVLLECPLVAPRIRFHRDAVVAWCDASVEVRHVRAGEELAFGRVRNGLRGYLAIGEREGVIEEMPDREDCLVIRAIRGPHDVAIEDVECEVTPRLDRVGIRLRPLRALDVAIPADLKSIGMQCGTVQLHPDGSLVAMGPDHPVTGGYLQPMTVITSERWKLGQWRPGEVVRFEIVAPATIRTDSRCVPPL